MTVASPSQSTSSVRLSRAWTQALRWLWIGFALMSILVALNGVSSYYRELQTICDSDSCLSININSDDISTFAEAGLSIEAFTLVSIIPIIFSMLLFFAVAAFFMFNRADELVPIFVAFWFLTIPLGGPIRESIQSTGIFWQIAEFITLMIRQIGSFGFALTFPNGRFVPAWTRLLFLVAVPVIIIATVIARLNGANISDFVTLIIVFVGVSSQIYRFLRVSNQQERQQTKWVIAALIYVLFFIAMTISVLQYPLFSTAYGRIFSLLFATSVLSSLPLSILFTIQHYGLWDIDFYINRGIVYLSLTALLAVVFAGIFWGLQTVFNAILGSSQLGIQFIIPTAIVLLLFNPVRKRLRHFVDRRFYGIKMDYTRVIESTQQRIIDGDTSTNIGQYRTTARIGSGGMGEVYAGQDTQGKPVAIKVLLTQFEQNDEIKKRFLREAEATARLSHPNIVKILDFGEDSERLFIAMEYVEGQDWGTIVKSSGAIPLEQLLPRLEELASALDYVHENGIIHRDIKPSNVMIEGETNRAVLMDFGIAKIATELTALTGTSQIVGSLDYISPEQIQGQANIDYRTDIYSFGVMTYQLLTGELPFKKANAGALVMAHLVQPAPDATQLNPHIPDSVSDAIQCAMAKQPTERFDTVSAFVAAMQIQ